MSAGGAPSISTGRGLALGRRATSLFLALLTLTFVGGVVLCGAADLDVLALWTQDEDLTTAARDAGWTPRALTAYLLTLEAATAAVGLATAVLVLRGELSFFRLYVAACLALHATLGGLVPLAYGAVLGLDDLFAVLQGLAWIAFFPLALVFPDGRFDPGWSRWVAVGWGGYFAATLVLGVLQVPGAGALDIGAALVLLALTVAAALQRYRRADDLTRRRTRWFVVAFAGQFLVLAAGGLLTLARGWSTADGTGLLAYLTVMSLSYAIAIVLPLTVAAAVTRHGLFGVDVWLSRGLVYATLTAVTLSALAVVVTGVWLLRPEGAGPIALLAVVLAAVVAVPAQRRVQQGVNRLLYGQRREPQRVVAELGDRLAVLSHNGPLADTVVEAIGTSLQLATVRLRVDQPTPMAAHHGEPAEADSLVDFPLVHRDRVFGVLQVAPRPGDRLTTADLELLRGLAHQVEGAVHAAAASREVELAHAHLVETVAAERVRLQHDLHDGLGPSLASLYQQIDAARSLLPPGSDAAAGLLDSAVGTARGVVRDVRRIIQELRPPELAERGLTGAVEHIARSLAVDPQTLTIDVTAEALPELGEEVEVAAYRIVSEALTNVVRHARAQRAHVILRGEGDMLHVQVTDDGVGLGEAAVSGTGIASMRERARGVNGAFEVTSGTGTTVYAVLPAPACPSPEAVS